MLFIFPGPVLPLNYGSHQRAFNLLYNLKAQGITVDVLIPENKNLEKNHLAQSLGMVCNQVFYYKDRRKQYGKVRRFLRGVEKRLRKMMGISGALPDFFSERAYQKPTESCKRWINSLYLAKNYSSIMVSYAWMLDAVKYIKHDRQNFNLICDMHDVQYYRNLGILNRKERLFFSQRREKNKELSYLSRCDAILPISVSDEKIIRQAEINAQVITTPPGFDYAKRTIKQRPIGRPIHFGFIGGGMSANVDSLNFVLNEWWPVIKKYSPDSILYVAGSICHNPDIQAKTFLDDHIVELGFVKNLDDFYTRFEVSLNPVLVAGGLNFKSVEAVMFGKHLFTNALGMECLGEDFVAKVIEQPDEICSMMNSIEFQPREDKFYRMKAQQQAESSFSNANVLTQLVSYLDR